MLQNEFYKIIVLAHGNLVIHTAIMLTTAYNHTVHSVSLKGFGLGDFHLKPVLGVWGKNYITAFFVGSFMWYSTV